LPARDRIALERQIRALGVELCTTERDDSIHNEFRMLLCVAAYRRQVLTPERWARMRRLLYSGGRWLEELRELYAVMMGVPLLEPLSRGKYDILQVDDIEPLLSILDRMVDEPAWMPDREEVIAAQANHQELLKREFAKAPEKMLDRLCLTLYINADSDRQEKMRRLWTQSGYHRLLSLIGYTPEEVTAELEEIEPEQIDADDQGAIDDNANDLLQDIDF